SAPLFSTIRTHAKLSKARVDAYGTLTGVHGKSGKLPTNAVVSLTWEPVFRLLSHKDWVEDLFQLVHLDNEVRWHVQTGLRADQEVEVEAQVCRVEEAAHGRTIATRCLVYAEQTLVATVRSTFFVRGTYGHTPWKVQAKEPVSATFSIDSESALTFVQQQQWLKWLAQEPIALGAEWVLDAWLSERIPRSGTPTFDAQGTLSCAGRVVAEIDFSATTAWKQHPVRAMLSSLEVSAHNERATAPRLLARAYTTAPWELDSFAEVSGDFNPIHRSCLMAWMGGLEEPIVHGMWTAARLDAFVKQHVAKGKSEKLRAFRVSFMETVRPGETLLLEAQRVGLRDAALVVEATAFVLRGTDKIPVAKANVEVEMPKTAYIFPGQGIQQTGMGMDAYGQSKAARRVWDQADAYTRLQLGFSILRIVRENPRELMVNGERLVHPQGVLHLTQFTQVAMAVLAQAQVAELRASGLLLEDAVICGHSVGEYNAIGVSGILPLQTVVDMVYQRGMVMHRLVERDASGESGYRMAVIRPHYAGLNHTQAEALVQSIRQQTGAFLQIVNYNVRGRQYSVTGEMAALKALEQSLSEKSRGQKAPYLEIPGIDVPFHSEVLVDGVEHFRDSLNQKFPEVIDYQSMLGRYIPNLVPRAFTLEKAYLKEVLETTRSEVMQQLVDGYEEHIQQPHVLARTLLIELLAWQFASPVRWIETQELMMLPKSTGGLGVERIIEIGVGFQPTLANMARYSQKLMGHVAQDIEILNVEAEA
ncbi:MAG: acyltransferase domain-containing protein, partial [Myxococcota bacterium]